MNYYISDTHFSHKNILKFEDANRPFSDISQMDAEMIFNWNATVRDSDNVYILGDVSFAGIERTEKILSQLKGRKILIFGNHDKVIKNNKTLHKYFVSMQEYLEVKIDGINIIMFHYPISNWNMAHYGSIHLYGHVHSQFCDNIYKKNSYNVCADINYLQPCTLEEVIKNNIRWREKLAEIHKINI